MISWDYSQERPYKGDTIEDKRRMYLHIYFNSEKAFGHGNNFNAMLEELVSGRRKAEHEKQYTKYFNISTTPVRGTKVTVKQEAVDAAKRIMGSLPLLAMKSRSR